MSKETYYYVKRDLLHLQRVSSPRTHKTHERPITVSKETYYYVKRDLLLCQKRPTTSANPQDTREFIETKRRRTFHGTPVFLRNCHGTSVSRPMCPSDTSPHNPVLKQLLPKILGTSACLHTAVINFLRAYRRRNSSNSRRNSRHAAPGGIPGEIPNEFQEEFQKGFQHFYLDLSICAWDTL